MPVENTVDKRGGSAVRPPARPLQLGSGMGGFTMRRWLLIASMLLCRIALAEEPVEVPFKLLAAVKPVSMETVDKVIEASDRAVQACNHNVGRADTLAVLMHITIGADGRVEKVEAVPSDSDGGKAQKEAACLARVAKKLKFPATGAVSHVHYPFMLVSTAHRAAF
ncbi:MAG: hypothetical protein JWN44_4237 [Myxococcales bacterium]|nr:hypothetical protein [Myxococcales bacterium]